MLASSAAIDAKNPDMPELPEVEIVRRGLEPALDGRVFARIDQHRPDLRFPLPDNFAARLRGRKVERLERRENTCSPTCRADMYCSCTSA